MYSAVTEMKQKVLSTWEMIQLTEIKRKRNWNRSILSLCSEINTLINIIRWTVTILSTLAIQLCQCLIQWFEWKVRRPKTESRTSLIMNLNVKLTSRSQVWVHIVSYNSLWVGHLALLLTWHTHDGRYNTQGKHSRCYCQHRVKRCSVIIIGMWRSYLQ